jgi:hypothetical protein
MSMPISRAASGSSEVARNARPSLVRFRNSASDPSTTTAVRKVSSGSHPIPIVSLTLMLDVFNFPTLRPWVSAVYFSSNAFWMTMPSPKVATIWNAGSTPTTRSKTTLCRM